MTTTEETFKSISGEDAKKAALELIQQITLLEDAKDKNYKHLLLEKNKIVVGGSPVSFHLNALRELVEAI